MSESVKAIELLKERDYDLEAAYRGNKSAAERLMRRQRDFQEAIRPLVRLRGDVHGFGVTKILINDDGSLGEVSYKFTDEQQKQLDQIDALIDQVRQSFFGANRPK